MSVEIYSVIVSFFPTSVWWDFWRKKNPPLTTVMVRQDCVFERSSDVSVGYFQLREALKMVNFE